MIRIHYALWAIAGIVCMFSGALTSGLINAAASEAKAGMIVDLSLADLTEYPIKKQ